MGLRLHNTLSKHLEEFVPRVAGKVSMYVCGPTVYDSSHLGHMRAAVVFDVLRRYLESQGYRVTHVQNVTDVEDKIIARAQAEGVPPDQITSQYGEEYHRAARALNILPWHVEPRATQHVPEMIEMIQGLMDRGFAYYAEGDVYFDVTKLPGYGKLSGRVLEELKIGARVEPGEFKRHPADFALWKRAKPGEPSWDSPWGKGRPGWHIECSAMSLKYLGMGFDIHGGGDDLIFPHHENEIAQSEAYAGREPFARYWIHNAMFQLGGEKMSKSQHHYVAATEALAHYPAEVIRYVLVAVHYRKPMEYHPDRFEEARTAVQRISGALASVESALRRVGSGTLAKNATTMLEDASARARAEFQAAMDDDLNTSGAIAAIFDLVAEINRAADPILKGSEPAEAHAEDLKKARDTMNELLGILGLRIEPVFSDPTLSTFGIKTGASDSVIRGVEGRVRDLVAEFRQEAPHLFSGDPGETLDEVLDFILEGRRRARALKDFAMADRIRARLSEAGVLVEDLPTGSRWRVVGTDGRAP